MNDEKLFEMLETCIAEVVTTLEQGDVVAPFAMILECDDIPRRLAFDESDHERHYTLLHEAMQAEAAHGEIKAAALIARVNIPDSFGPAVPEGIRIHIEERASSSEKLSARLLYVPYQLYKSSENGPITVHLHAPISVGMPAEIFV